MLSAEMYLLNMIARTPIFGIHAIRKTNGRWNSYVIRSNKALENPSDNITQKPTPVRGRMLQ